MMVHRIVRVLQVKDTRVYDPDLEMRIPRSGDERPCDRCGRLHEVHVTVLLEDGTTACIGTGCARRDEMAMVRRAVRAAQRRDQLERRLAQAEADLARLEAVEREVEALPLPPITGPTPATDGRVRWDMGDTYCYAQPGPLSHERQQCLVDSWKRNRLEERGVTTPPWIIRERVEDLRRNLARLSDS